jgi:hypothetical protein
MEKVTIRIGNEIVEISGEASAIYTAFVALGNGADAIVSLLPSK